MNEHQGATSAPRTGAEPDRATPVGDQVQGQDRDQGPAAHHYAANPYPGYAPWFAPPPWPVDPRFSQYGPYSGFAHPGAPSSHGANPMWMPPDAYSHGHQGYGPDSGAGQGARVSELVDEIASGGNGLSSLSKMLNLDDVDFWKGALVGAAAVLLLTSDSVQNALFRNGSAANPRNGSEDHS
jgi:hypothetical protein